MTDRNTVGAEGFYIHTGVFFAPEDRFLVDDGEGVLIGGTTTQAVIRKDDGRVVVRGWDEVRPAGRSDDWGDSVEMDRRYDRLQTLTEAMSWLELADDEEKFSEALAELEREVVELCRSLWSSPVLDRN